MSIVDEEKDPHKRVLHSRTSGNTSSLHKRYFNSSNMNLALETLDEICVKSSQRKNGKVIVARWQVVG